MDEFPRHAQALLELTRDAHDPPDPMARARVAARLSSLALLPRLSEPLSPPVLHPAATSASGASSLASSKFLLAGVVAMTLGGGLWALSARRVAHPPAPVVAAGARDAETAPAASTPRRLEVTALPSTQAVPATRAAAAVEAPPTLAPSARNARPQLASSQHGSLAEETALLRRASEQLAHGELDGALATLADHRRRFARSQLGEERAGLRVLAYCMRNPSQARPEAKSFVARAPGSVLVTRMVSACEL